MMDDDAKLIGWASLGCVVVCLFAIGAIGLLVYVVRLAWGGA